MKEKDGSRSAKRRILAAALLALLAVLALAALLSRPGLRSPGMEETATAIVTEYQQLLGQEQSLADPVLNVLQNGLELQISQMEKPSKKGMDVQCLVRNYDLPAAAAQMQQECGGREFPVGSEYRRVLAQLLLEQEKRTAEVVIRLEPDGRGGWRASFPREALDQAAGGLLSALTGAEKEGEA